MAPPSALLSHLSHPPNPPVSRVTGTKKQLDGPQAPPVLCDFARTAITYTPSLPGLRSKVILRDLTWWVSKCGPRTCSSASPGNVLEV